MFGSCLSRSYLSLLDPASKGSSHVGPPYLQHHELRIISSIRARSAVTSSRRGANTVRWSHWTPSVPRASPLLFTLCFSTRRISVSSNRLPVMTGVRAITNRSRTGFLARHTFASRRRRRCHLADEDRSFWAVCEAARREAAWRACPASNRVRRPAALVPRGGSSLRPNPRGPRGAESSRGKEPRPTRLVPVRTQLAQPREP
jgi:hypothetical protein